MPIKLDDFYGAALDRIEANVEANVIVPRLLRWLVIEGEMDAYHLEYFVNLTPDLDPEDWSEQVAFADLRVDVSYYSNMSEGLLKHTQSTLSFAHETIRVFLCTARSFDADDWCLRSIAAFMVIPRMIRYLETEMIFRETHVLADEVWARDEERFVDFLQLEWGMAWYIPRNMHYADAHRVFWRPIEDRLRLPSILVCARLGWFGHASEALDNNAVDATSTDQDGRNVLHLLMRIEGDMWPTRPPVFRWDRGDLIKALFSSDKIDMSAQDHSGDTALHTFVRNPSAWTACREYDIRIQEYWGPLCSGPHCTVYDRDGLTPLHLAAQAANMPAMRLLARWSSTCINHLSGHGHTPIAWALHSLWVMGQIWLTPATWWRYRNALPGLHPIQENGRFNSPLYEGERRNNLRAYCLGGTSSAVPLLSFSC